MPKMQVDAKARREYRGKLNVYGELLNTRLNAGKIAEDKFWKLQDKLSQWHDNFRPLVEVQDSTKV